MTTEAEAFFEAHKNDPLAIKFYNAANNISEAKFATGGLTKANANTFSNVDPDTGYPILNQAKLDAIIKKYGDNVKGNSPARMMFNTFGWGQVSDSSQLLHGPAIVGLYTGTTPTGGVGTSKSAVLNSKGVAATQADYEKAAKAAGLDTNAYIRPTKFVPATMGMGATEKANKKNSAQYVDPITKESYLARIDNKGNYVTSMDTSKLFNDISTKTKDLYLVANAIDNVGANKATPHASMLFRADGSGNLTPVLNADKQPIVNYYSAERVHHGGWQEQLSQLAAPLSMVAMAFAPQFAPALQGALGVSGATASVLSGTLINVGMAALTGGDIGKAALTGAIGGVISANAGDIAKGLFSPETLNSIAKATNLTAAQVTDLISKGVTTGLTSAITDPDHIGTNIIAGVASNFASSSVKNLVTNNINMDNVNVAAKAAGSAAGIATNALAKGQDVGEALQNGAAGIAFDAAKTLAKSPDTTKAGLPTDQVSAFTGEHPTGTTLDEIELEEPPIDKIINPDTVETPPPVPVPELPTDKTDSVDVPKDSTPPVTNEETEINPADIPPDPNQQPYDETDPNVDPEVLDPEVDVINPADIPPDPNQQPYDETDPNVDPNVLEGNGTTPPVVKPPVVKPPVTPPVKPPVTPPTTPPKTTTTTGNRDLSALMSLLGQQQAPARNITPPELSKIGYFYDVGGEDIFAPTQVKDKPQEDKFKQFYATGGTVDDLFRILRN